MRINQHNTTFTAVTIKPNPVLWSKKVLNSVLESQKITDMIKENEKNGLDSVLQFNETLNFSSFSLQSKGKNLSLWAGDTARITDHENDLVKAIQKLDNKSEETRLERNLEKLKTIASGVIYK